MRLVLSALLASGIIGTSAVGLSPHARDLLTGIFQDVGAILNSFAGGPNDPHNPVTDARTLQDDSARLDAATQKANDLASELSNLTNPKPARDH